MSLLIGIVLGSFIIALSVVAIVDERSLLRQLEQTARVLLQHPALHHEDRWRVQAALQGIETIRHRSWLTIVSFESVTVLTAAQETLAQVWHTVYETPPPFGRTPRWLLALAFRLREIPAE